MIFDYNNDVYKYRVSEVDMADDETVDSIINDLKDMLNSSPNLVYVCANSIGINARAFIIKFGDEPKVFLNPAFTKAEGTKLVRELDDASGKEYIIPRASSLVLCYTDEEGKMQANLFKDEAAMLIHKLVESLDGVHTADYGLEVLPGFNELPDESKEEIIADYIAELDKLNSDLDKDLSECDDTKKQWLNYKFNRAKALGEVEVEYEEDKPLNRKQRRWFEKFSKKIKRGKKK